MHFKKQPWCYFRVPDTLNVIPSTFKWLTSDITAIYDAPQEDMNSAISIVPFLCPIPLVTVAILVKLSYQHILLPAKQQVNYRWSDLFQEVNNIDILNKQWIYF